MKSLTCLALLATAAAGSPVQKIFNLETSGAANSEHNGLYLSTYHTSPDTSDAVFVKNVQDAQSFYVNNNGTVTLEVTSSLQRAIELITINYAKWSPVQVNINSSAGAKGFFISSTGLQGPSSQGFNGWLVCDWYHNKPQLFFLNKNYNATTIPSSCSRVQLTPDYNVSS